MTDHVLPISVVIPAYNRERFIANAIESALRQTRPPAQVIVVDDGSVDRTGDVAEALGATVIRQANGGVSRARNVGIDSAAAPWIAFLDSDDTWLPEKLEYQWAALSACPEAGMAFTDRIAIDEHGPVPGSVFTVNRDYSTVARLQITPNAVSLDRDQMCGALVRANFVTLSSLMARRDLVRQVGGFAETMRYCEDIDLILRLAAATAAVAVEVPSVVKRIHVEGASRDRARMQLGRAEIAGRVVARPDLYPPVALEPSKRERPDRFKRAGLTFFSEGDFAESADALSRSLQLRFDVIAAAVLPAARLLGALGAERPFIATRDALRRARAFGRVSRR